MVAAEAPVRNDQALVLTPVYCMGWRPSGTPCPQMIGKGDLRRVTNEQIAVFQVKCHRCGNLVLLG